MLLVYIYIDRYVLSFSRSFDKIRCLSAVLCSHKINVQVLCVCINHACRLTQDNNNYHIRWRKLYMQIVLTAVKRLTTISFNIMNSILYFYFFTCTVFIHYYIVIECSSCLQVFHDQDLNDFFLSKPPTNQTNKIHI